MQQLTHCGHRSRFVDGLLGRLLLTYMTSVETLPMTYENMVVPQTIVRHATILSMSFVGTKSP